MKMKKKAVIAAAAFAVAMNLSACAYGPPEDYEDTPQTEEITSFDPAENQTVGVYGPPGEEWDYDETDTSEEEQNVGEEALNNE